MSNIRAEDGETEAATGTFVVKAGLAQMLKGGIIMDVVNAEQARIAEEAGACAVMALEKVPADIRKDGGVARMADPKVWFSVWNRQCLTAVMVLYNISKLSMASNCYNTNYTGRMHICHSCIVREDKGYR